ncbi:MAG: hypothetical protein ACI9ON_003917, partial [Limisphaerales bacterium]
DVQPKPLKAIAFINQTSQSAAMPVNPPLTAAPSGAVLLSGALTLMVYSWQGS